MKKKKYVTPSVSLVNRAPQEGRFGKHTTKGERKIFIDHAFINDGGLKYIARKTGRVV
ncbi:MAG: hypothetical protein WCG07_02110 [Candidatus Taylorbacteria bacterium]